MIKKNLYPELYDPLNQILFHIFNCSFDTFNLFDLSAEIQKYRITISEKIRFI